MKMHATWRNVTMTALAVLCVSVPARAETSALPIMNMDDYSTDALATIALGEDYPKGSPMGLVVQALGQSIPEFSCVKQDATYVCQGLSVARGSDLVYLKTWTVIAQASTDGKLESIRASSQTEAAQDDGHRAQQPPDLSEFGF